MVSSWPITRRRQRAWPGRVAQLRAERVGCVNTTWLQNKLDPDGGRVYAPHRRLASAGYVVAAAAGVATHLYALLPLAAQAAALLVRGAFDRRWGARLGAAIVKGVKTPIRR